VGSGVLKHLGFEVSQDTVLEMPMERQAASSDSTGSV
jgi:hypothetical protein